MDIVERLRTTEPDQNGSRPKWYINPDGTEAADEIERLRKANKRLGEIAADAVEWLPPASVNGPREEYQNEIKELTE